MKTSSRWSIAIGLGILLVILGKIVSSGWFKSWLHAILDQSFPLK